MADPEARGLIRDDGAIAFGRGFASSEAFKTLFREGMDLVEETAAYLDGPGREEAKGLPRLIALTYANESMRLTTRLMQIASWLLLQRAVSEGEMTHSDASRQNSKMRLSRHEVRQAADGAAHLPSRLIELIELSLRMQSRIIHLDGTINQAPATADRMVARNAVALQQLLIHSAFSAKVTDKA